MPETHGLQKCWVGSTDFGRMNVTVSILLQSPIVAAKDEACEHNAFIAARTRLEIGDVIACVRSVAHDQEFVSGANAFKGFNYEVRIVFWFQTRNVQHITVGLHSPAAHERVWAPLDFSAVGDHS